MMDSNLVGVPKLGNCHWFWWSKDCTVIIYPCNFAVYSEIFAPCTNFRNYRNATMPVETEVKCVIRRIGLLTYNIWVEMAFTPCQVHVKQNFQNIFSRKQNLLCVISLKQCNKWGRSTGWTDGYRSFVICRKCESMWMMLEVTPKMSQSVLRSYAWYNLQNVVHLRRTDSHRMFNTNHQWKYDRSKLTGLIFLERYVVFVNVFKCCRVCLDKYLLGNERSSTHRESSYRRARDWIITRLDWWPQVCFCTVLGFCKTLRKQNATLF